METIRLPIREGIGSEGKQFLGDAKVGKYFLVSYLLSTNKTKKPVITKQKPNFGKQHIVCRRKIGK